MFEFIKDLFSTPPQKKRDWVCNVAAAYTRNGEVLLSWQYMLFVDEDDERICEISLNRTQQVICESYGGAYNHPRYVDVIVPWLHGCCINTRLCSTYNSDPEKEHHFVFDDKKQASPPMPETPRPSATILKLVKTDETEPEASKP